MTPARLAYERVVHAAAALLVLVARLRVRWVRRLAGSVACWLTWRSRAVRFRFVYDNEYGDTFDPRNACNVYAGPRCGGCDDCVIDQAQYYGAPIYPVPVSASARDSEDAP